jgi:hypothetical protein
VFHRDEHGINAAEAFARTEKDKNTQSNNAGSLKCVDGKQAAMLGR